MVIDKEYLKLFGQKQRSFLKHKIDSFKYEIANLALISCYHTDQRRTDFVIVSTNGFRVWKVVHILND